MRTRKLFQPDPIRVRLAENYKRDIGYHEFMRAVFPEDRFPRAWKYQSIIAGGRHIMDQHLVDQAMDRFLSEVGQPTEIVSGGATGVDEMGEHWAKVHNVPIKRFPADWHKHGKAAGPIRNGAMGHYATCLVAIYDGQSKGTGNMISQMQQFGKPVYVWRV